MSTIAVPDDIIHHILEYVKVLDIIRARLVCQHIPISFHSVLIFYRRLDAFGWLLTRRTSSQYGYGFSLYVSQYHSVIHLGSARWTSLANSGAWSRSRKGGNNSDQGPEYAYRISTSCSTLTPRGIYKITRCSPSLCCCVTVRHDS